jgi:hypothetical protein
MRRKHRATGSKTVSTEWRKICDLAKPSITGVQCPYGDACCWGHVCPNGPKCFHLSKGKCWFKGGEVQLCCFISVFSPTNWCQQKQCIPTARLLLNPPLRFEATVYKPSFSAINRVSCRYSSSQYHLIRSLPFFGLSMYKGFIWRGQWKEITHTLSACGLTTLLI